MIKKIKNRIVITGGSGFIGTNLLICLKNKKINNLLVIDKHKPFVESVEVISGNFGDRKLLEKVLNNDDVIIHLACSSIPATSELNREKDIKENIIGTLNLLEICRQKKIKKIIFLSSGGTIYGDYGNKILQENLTPKPLCSHGIMKLMIEKYIKLFQNLYGLNYIIIRAGNPYGWLFNREKKQGIIDVFLRKAVNDEILEIWGDGKIVRDYIYIDDLTNFIIETIKNDITNKIFNAGTGVGTSINSLLNIISKITEKKLKIVYLKKRNFDVRYNVLNIDKAYKLLGWKPKINIETGIKKIYKNITNS